MSVTPQLLRFAFPSDWYVWRSASLTFNGSDRSDGKPSLAPDTFGPASEGTWMEVQLSCCETGKLTVAIARLNSHYWFLRDTKLTPQQMTQTYQVRARRIGVDRT
jgi:hypothetical protein